MKPVDFSQDQFDAKQRTSNQRHEEAAKLAIEHKLTMGDAKKLAALPSDRRHEVLQALRARAEVKDYPVERTNG